VAALTAAVPRIGRRLLIGVARLVRGRGGDLVAERDRWFLWATVLVGAGIGIYFALPVEPRLLSVLALAVAALALQVAWREGLAAVVIGGALLSLATGLAAAKIRTELAGGPTLTRPLYNTDLRGYVELVEPRPGRGQRITLRVSALGRFGTAERPVRARVRILSGGALRPGDAIRLNATLAAPALPSLPGDYDFARAAWFRGIGAVGYAIRRPQIDDGAAPPPLDLAAWAAVERVRLAIGARIHAAVPGKTGAIAAALINGGSLPLYYQQLSIYFIDSVYRLCWLRRGRLNMTKPSKHRLNGPIVRIRRGVAVYKTHASPYYYARILEVKSKQYKVRSTKETSRLQARVVAEELALELNRADAPATREFSFKYCAHRLILKGQALIRSGERNKNYIRTIKLFLDHDDWGLVRHFGSRDVRELTTRDWLLFMEDLTRKRPDLAASTRNMMMVAFRNVMKVARDDGLIDVVPGTPRTRHKDNPRPFFRFAPLVPEERDEYQRLLDGAKELASWSAPIECSTLNVS